MSFTAGKTKWCHLQDGGGS